MLLLQHSMRCAALVALFCLSNASSHGQAGIAHKGYRGHGVQITYADFLTVTEVDPSTVSFLFEGAGFVLQRAATADLPGVMTQLQAQMIQRSFKVSSLSADQMEGVGENGWFMKAALTQDHGATYILYAFAPREIYDLISGQFAEMQRTLVFDAQQGTTGPGVSPSGGGCPGCGSALSNTMNNLTQHTAGH